MKSTYQFVLDRTRFADSDIGFLREILLQHLSISLSSFNQAFRSSRDIVFEANDPVDEVQYCLTRLEEAGLPVSVVKKA